MSEPKRGAEQRATEARIAADIPEPALPEEWEAPSTQLVAVSSSPPPLVPIVGAAVVAKAVTSKIKK